jgi:hypothetical protein
VLVLIGRIKLVQPEFFARFDPELFAIVQSFELLPPRVRRGPWLHCDRKMSVRSTFIASRMGSDRAMRITGSSATGGHIAAKLAAAMQFAGRRA